MWSILLAACAPPSPPPARAPLAPVRPCPAVPDAIVAALGEEKVAPAGLFADRVASLGPDARCPVAFGPDGWAAAVVTAPARAAVVRSWRDGPSEVFLERPLPLDAERRIAGSPAWLPEGTLGPLEGWVGPIAGVDLGLARAGPALELRWCAAEGCGCFELIWGFETQLQRFWACPGTPPPPMPPGAVPWPNPADRE